MGPREEEMEEMRVMEEKRREDEEKRMQVEELQKELEEKEMDFERREEVIRRRLEELSRRRMMEEERRQEFIEALVKQYKNRTVEELNLFSMSKFLFIKQCLSRVSSYHLSIINSFRKIKY